MNWVQINIQVNGDFRYMKNLKFTTLSFKTDIPLADALLVFLEIAS